MSRKRTPGDFVPAMGTAFEIFAALQKLGVRDADWRILLSDKDQAARVATALRTRIRPRQSATFDDLLRLARLDELNMSFTANQDAIWTNQGDGVRGDFRLMDMEGDYTKTGALAAIAQKAEWIAQPLLPATAYELLYYAALGELDGWDGQTPVAAFGSSFQRPGSEQLETPSLVLSPDNRKRWLSSLALEPINQRWRVLYIVK